MKLINIWNRNSTCKFLSVYIAQLQCFMIIELFKIINWVLQSSFSKFYGSDRKLRWTNISDYCGAKIINRRYRNVNGKTSHKWWDARFMFFTPTVPMHIWFAGKRINVRDKIHGFSSKLISRICVYLVLRVRRTTVSPLTPSSWS